VYANEYKLKKNYYKKVKLHEKLHSMKNQGSEGRAFSSVYLRKLHVWLGQMGQGKLYNASNIMVYSRSDLARIVLFVTFFYLHFVSLYLNGSVLHKFLS